MDLIATYHLPGGLGFEGSCLGTSSDVALAGLVGKVWLPAASWGSREPSLTHPPLNNVSTSAKAQLAAKDPWGIVYSWREQPQEIVTAVVQKIVFQLLDVGPGEITRDAATRDDPPARGADEPSTEEMAEKLCAQVEPWFEAVGAWIRVLIDHDLESSVDESPLRTSGDGLEVLNIDQESNSAPEAPSARGQPQA
jgi:hypothetical protein